MPVDAPRTVSRSREPGPLGRGGGEAAGILDGDRREDRRHGGAIQFLVVK